MKTSPEGRKQIAKHEGNKLETYKDIVGVWTIGVGHTAGAGNPIPKAGMRITFDESDAILSQDLVTFEKAVLSAVKVPLNQNQFDALVSLAFNIGAGAFSKSTLVRKLNAKDYKGAAEQFLVWNKAGGRTVQGLVNRRKAEKAWFERSPFADVPAEAVEPVLVVEGPKVASGRPNLLVSLLVLLRGLFR